MKRMTKSSITDSCRCWRALKYADLMAQSQIFKPERMGCENRSWICRFSSTATSARLKTISLPTAIEACSLPRRSGERGGPGQPGATCSNRALSGRVAAL